MTFGQRLVAAREAKGFNQKQLAEELKISPTRLNYWEKDKRQPEIAMIQALAATLECTTDYLIGNPINEKAPTLSAEALKLAKTYDALDEHGQRVVRVVADEELARLAAESVQKPDDAAASYLRHYFTAAAAGYTAPVEGEDFELIARTPDIPANADYCIEISGDSMEPYIKDGQRVYVQRDAELHVFQPGIFYVDGSVYCKQWCIDHMGTLYLLSANPLREDANITIPKDSGRSVICFGKVLLKKKLPQPVYR